MDRAVCDSHSERLQSHQAGLATNSFLGCQDCHAKQASGNVFRAEMPPKYIDGVSQTLQIARVAYTPKA